MKEVKQKRRINHFGVLTHFGGFFVIFELNKNLYSV